MLRERAGGVTRKYKSIEFKDALDLPKEIEGFFVFQQEKL